MLLLLTFIVVVFIQVYFYFFLFRKYILFSKPKNKARLHPVSVIVCAKNEEGNIKNLLQSLSLQNYHSFELILVDDGSIDNTWNEMLIFQNSHEQSSFQIKLIQISQKESKGKKSALTKGIHAAENPIILLTDADCEALSEQWIFEMSSCFSSNINVVLGYGAYEKINNSFLNKLIRFETVLTAIQYFSYAIDGNAYMGVGRNLAYKKSAFIKADGFDQHSHIKSGDDDLFVSQISQSNSVMICDHKDSFTISKAHTNFSSWIRQKRRHITTAIHYGQKTKILLSLFYMSQFLFYFLFLFSIISKTFHHIIIPLAIIRFVFWYMLIIKTTKRLNEKDLIAFGPLYEISIIFIQLYIFIKNIISPPKYW